MTGFLSFLAAQRSAILLLLLIAAVAVGLAQWILWMFGQGRFARSTNQDSTTRYVVEQFFVRIIVEFRNLFALIVVSVFAFALFFAMTASLWSCRNSDCKDLMTNLKDGLQGVAASLGGLIGSIIGFYFGQAAAKGNQSGDVSGAAPPSPAQQGPPPPPPQPGLAPPHPGPPAPAVAQEDIRPPVQPGT